MWTPLLTSITTSFLDSLNPSAIAQQMLLQAMVNNKRYIWYFISGIGAANLALGAAIYYGVAEWVLGLISALAAREPERFYGTTLVAGLFCFLLGLWLLARATGRRKTSQEQTAGVKNPARLSPPALFCLGAVFCVVELPSALPYFAFLTVLAGFHPSFPLVLLFLMIYNFMYLLPLILLYFVHL